MIINLFYPASYLHHKNHIFLKNRKIINFLEKNNINIFLTIDSNIFDINSENIKLIGRVSHSKCFEIMSNSSALLFLSGFETLGLPILEASSLKKSIIIPNLQYAKELLGKSGYFIKYPLDEENFISVLKKFKDDFVNNSNYPAQITPNILSSKELLNIFLNKLNV